MRSNQKSKKAADMLNKKFKLMITNITMNWMEIVTVPLQYILSQIAIPILLSLGHFVVLDQELELKSSAFKDGYTFPLPRPIERQYT